MKQNMQFLQKFFLQMLGLWCFVAFVVVGGSMFVSGRTESSLFFVYLGMFPWLSLILPCVIAWAIRTYLMMAIAFGAVRKELFWTLQLLLLGYSAVTVALVFGVGCYANTLPAQTGYSSISPERGAPWVIFFLVMLLMEQVALCFAQWVDQTALRLTIGVACAVFGVFAGTGMVIAGDYVAALLRVTSPWLWCIGGALLALTVGFLLLARRLYTKMSVHI